MNKLTREQALLVEENHNLILSYLSNRHLPVWESDVWYQEDWYGAAATGLCNAARTYQPGISAFSTYAYVCMEREINKTYQKHLRSNKIPNEIVCSLDLVYDNDDEGYCLYDCVPSPDDTEREVITKEAIRELIASQKSGKNRLVMELYFAGWSQTEIAKLLGITRAAISAKLIHATKMRADLKPDGLMIKERKKHA